MQFVWILMMQGLSLPPHGSFIVVRSYSQSILRLGGLRSVLSKMYSFMQCFYWIKVYNLVVLCYFKDIMKACNFWTEDTVLYTLGSVSTVHKAFFSCSMQQLNQLNAGAQCLSILITKSHSILFWQCEVKCLSLFVLALGLYPVDQKKSEEGCFKVNLVLSLCCFNLGLYPIELRLHSIDWGSTQSTNKREEEIAWSLFYKYSNLYTVQTVWLDLYNKIYSMIWKPVQMLHMFLSQRSVSHLTYF